MPITILACCLLTRWPRRFGEVVTYSSMSMSPSPSGVLTPYATGLQEQVAQLASKLGRRALATLVDSMPSKIRLLSACTGSGCFELAAHAAMNSLLADFGGKHDVEESCQHLHVSTFNDCCDCLLMAQIAEVKPVVACEITPFKQKFLQKHVLAAGELINESVVPVVRRCDINIARLSGLCRPSLTDWLPRMANAVSTRISQSSAMTRVECV